MSLNSSWQPVEKEITIINERTWLAGMILTSVEYGIVFTLFVLTFKQLIKTTTKHNLTQRISFIIYITVMFILGTLYLGSIARMIELSFIDNRLFPGGPAAFEQLAFFSSIGNISHVSFVIINWLANGMLIYRYLVIFRSTRRQCPLWIIMLIPVLAYAATFSLSVVWLIQASSPWNAPSDGAINFITPYCWLSFSLNLFMTIAICARLLFFRRRIASILGPNYGTQYTSVVTILVESSSLSSTFTLLFFIPFALNNPIQNAFIQPLGEIQIIASLLIIYRVAYGAAWASDTSKTILGTKETQNSQGVRVQIEFSGPCERPSNRSSKDFRNETS